MNKTDRIRAKIRKIQDLCTEVTAELDELGRELEANQTKNSAKTEMVLPTEEECRREFDRLYDEYIAGNPKAVEKLVNEKSKDYLKIFCKANNLSVDTKRASKERVISEVLQWLAQRKAITGSISSG